MTARHCLHPKASSSKPSQGLLRCARRGLHLLLQEYTSAHWSEEHEVNGLVSNPPVILERKLVKQSFLVGGLGGLGGDKCPVRSHAPPALLL